MDQLAERIGANTGLDRPVIDKTGLGGNFALSLSYTPMARMLSSGDPEHKEISIFSAVQEQLGLRLVKQTALMNTIFVDHIERPSGN